MLVHSQGLLAQGHHSRAAQHCPQLLGQFNQLDSSQIEPRLENTNPKKLTLLAGIGVLQESNFKLVDPERILDVEFPTVGGHQDHRGEQGGMGVMRILIEHRLA